MNYYALIARSLIALLFVIAGIQKAMNFEQTSGFVATLVPASLADIVTALVIVIEVPVALAFAWGWRTCTMGSILAGFTALATLLAHRDFSVGANMIMALKNIAIIGGIMLALPSCDCGICPPSKKSSHNHEHTHHQG
ncbi:MAG: putative oxidoreductase [Patescibacteria group bacterium]|nr:putative oxidoreductase [Patescibacteria group bacterium]